ncbi:MAG: ribosome recycling factor [Deltaproteobacteria bacterium]|jgi:ribosome recycling factor|nr:ribosome recycling factor [Deltaproteobacteria bacterium]MBW2533882.1 ribosome recycling factor [Deltaproteobacteria bacterium]
MIDEVLEDLEESLGKALAALRRELSKVRTGRAHPSILDRIRVDYYGVATPLAQMSTITVPDPRLLVVKAWERGQVKAIDKAIRESELGLNPQVDGDLIRIPIPPLTEERRKEMVKLTKRAGEDGKVAVRKHRRDAMSMLSDLQKEGEVSEDAADRARKKVEDIVGDKVKEVDQAVADREKDIMAV